MPPVGLAQSLMAGSGRELENARPARPEDRADAIGRLSESVVRVRTSGHGGSRTNVSRACQRSTVTGQVGDVDNFEPFANQIVL